MSKSRLSWSLAISTSLLCATWAQDLSCQPTNGSQNFTVFDQADVDQLAQSCSNGVRAAIVVAPSWQGPLDLSNISAIQNGHGVFASGVSGLTSFAAPSLASIDGSLYFFKCENLVNISLPALQIASGGLSAHTVPKLTGLDLSALNASNTTSYSGLTLYNTSLSRLENVGFNALGYILIQQNPLLETINLTETRSIAHNLSVMFNHPSLYLGLPSLTTIGNLSLATVANVDMPAVSTATGSIIASNNTFKEFAMQALRNIYGGLIINNNLNLTGVRFPNVVTIGPLDYTTSRNSVKSQGLIVTDNPQLHRFDSNATGLPSRGSPGTSGLTRLYHVAGNLNIRGPFDNVDLPSLGIVDGSFSVNSSDPSYSCTDFDRRIWESPDYLTLEVKSHNYTCRASALGSNKDVAQHCCRPMAKGTKIGIGVGVALGVILIVGLAVGFCFRERIAKRWRYAQQRRMDRKEAKAAKNTNEVAPGHERDRQHRIPYRERDAGPLPPAYDEIAQAPSRIHEEQQASIKGIH